MTHAEFLLEPPLVVEWMLAIDPLEKGADDRRGAALEAVDPEHDRNVAYAEGRR